MAYETVTGYCWPQSVAGGERVALHLSSSGARPVDVEVAHIGATRTVVYSEAGIPAGDHPTPLDAPERGLRVARRIRRRRRAGLAVGLLRGHPDDRRRRQGPPDPRLLRRAPATWRPRPLGCCSRCRRTRGTPTTTSAAATSTPARTSVSMQRPMAPGYLYKPPGAGRRVTSLYPPDPQSASSRRLPPDEPPVALRRLGGLAELGAAVRRVGGS